MPESRAMVLRFLCPNGHKIHCPNQRAGKAAKCPKCGVKFQIPEVSDIEAAGSGDSLLAVSDSGSSVSIGAATRRQPSEPEIEFLCPNGHRLHGSASMQGRPGQCPDCGAKFRVPSYEEEKEQQQRRAASQVPNLEIEVVGDTRAHADVAVQGVDEHPRIESQEHPRPELQETPADPSADHEKTVLRVVPAEGSGLLGPVAEVSTLAGLFSKLWAEKAHGAQIELILSDGETLAPDRFAETLSRGSYALFSLDESDDTHTLTAVAWESIVRVVVRGVKQLPSDMLD